MKINKLFTLLCLLLSIGAMAQNGKVTGSVKDADSGEALIGATVTVKGTNLGIMTNQNGEFTLSNVPTGTQKVSVSFVGYAPETKEVSISAGQTATLTFSLTASLALSEEVVVSASRRAEKLTEAPASVSVITSKDLDQLASFNVGELASKIQGVEFVRTGVTGVGFNARGFNNAFNAKILAMTDGRNSMMAGGSGLPAGIMNTVIKEDIERVEIVLGPNSALYGPNAHNGVLNTITKDPRRYQGTTFVVDAGNQSVISGRLRHAMKLNDKLAFKVTGEFTKGKDFTFYDSVYVGGTFVAGIGNLYGPVRSVPEKVKSFDFKHIRGEAAVYYSVTPKADVIVSYGGSVNDFLAVNNVGRNQIDGWKFSYLQGRFVSPRLFGQVYYTWTNVGNSYGITPYTRDYTNRTTSIITTTSPFYPILGAGFGRLNDADAEKFALRYGNKFKEESGRLNGELQYNNSWDKIGLNMVASLSYQKDMPNTFGTSLADSQVPGEQGTLLTVEQFGGALQLDKKLTKGLKLVASARLDNHSVFGNLFAPKAALVQKLGNGHARLTYGRAYAAPIILFQYANVFGIVFGNGEGISYIPNGKNANDAASVMVTDPLKPEEIGTWELGYKGAIGKKFYIDVNGYYGRSENFLSPAISVGGRVQKVGDIAIPATGLLVPGTVNATTGVLSGGLFSTYFNYGQVDSWGVDVGLNYYITNDISLGIKYSNFGSDITEDNVKNDANRDGFVSAEEKSLNTAKNRVAGTLSFSNIAKKRIYANISARWVQQFDFYSGSQIATAAGQGKRGVVDAGVIPGTTTPRVYLKNFDYGPLGGFTTVDISAGYGITKSLTAGAAVSNLFNVEQREFVGSPTIGRLFSVEVKYHIPYNK